MTVTPGFNFLFTPGNSNITIDALARITNVKVLSSPSVVVQDNSEAVLTVGDEVPITTRQATGVDEPGFAHGQQHRVPRHRRDPPGAPAHQPERRGVARDRPGGQPGRRRPALPTTLTPTITQRKITSRVNVQSGQTVALGGLIQEQEQRNRDRVPVWVICRCWAACSAAPTISTSAPS